jgi:NTP pyrophosphatase (non-canonical NTP hydrolase)
MNIFVVVVEGRDEQSSFVASHWNEEVASRETAELRRKYPRLNITVMPVCLPNFSTMVNSYYQFRDYKDPDLKEAFNWLVSEVGELAGAINQTQIEGWVRNNDHTQDSVADELGDVLMMLIKTAEKAGVDVVDAMVNKWIRKGWEQ